MDEKKRKLNFGRENNPSTLTGFAFSFFFPSDFSQQSNGAVCFLELDIMLGC